MNVSKMLSLSSMNIYNAIEHEVVSSIINEDNTFEASNLKRIDSIISVCYHVPTTQKHLCIESTSYRLDDPKIARNIKRSNSINDQKSSHPLGTDF